MPPASKTDQRLILGTTEKILGLIIAVGTVLFSVGGNYVLVGYRVTEIEKKVGDHDHRIVQMEQSGHAEHERRISKLETREDGSDRTINEMSSRLDVAIAILQRIDKQVNKNSQ
jgi:hypothetical protein